MAVALRIKPLLWTILAWSLYRPSLSTSACATGRTQECAQHDARSGVVLLQTRQGISVETNNFAGVRPDFFEDGMAEQDDVVAAGTKAAMTQVAGAANTPNGVHVPRALPMEAEHVQAASADEKTETSDWGGLRSGIEAGLWVAATADAPKMKLPSSIMQISDTFAAPNKKEAPVDHSGKSLSAFDLPKRSQLTQTKTKNSKKTIQRMEHTKTPSKAAAVPKEPAPLQQTESEASGDTMDSLAEEADLMEVKLQHDSQELSEEDALRKDVAQQEAAVAEAGNNASSDMVQVLEQEPQIPVHYRSQEAEGQDEEADAALRPASVAGAERAPSSLTQQQSEVAVESATEAALCQPYCIGTAGYVPVSCETYCASYPSYPTGTVYQPYAAAPTPVYQPYAAPPASVYQPYVAPAPVYQPYPAPAYDDTLSGYYGPQPDECTPQCTWKCETPKCDEVCEPICKAPRCETRCQGADFSSCAMDCEEPHCAVVCPHKTCPTGGCPMCATTCSEPTCKLKCPGEQNCYSVCEQPDCEWKCTPPQDCPAPSCHMVCEQPHNCAGGTYRELPPVQPWETTVDQFVGGGVQNSTS
mmetsp:Transcript_35510/g.80098  ORF Transcript_35510/g.80098 Transcript_35510/m.80098 type:complete len:585 (-) Transcript_35510:68-1822(-)